jgi:hypothetical protein
LEGVSLMKRVILFLSLLALPAMACGLDTATPVPTSPPALLQSPVLGLNPVSGAPGTVVNVSAAGFPQGTTVNLFLAPTTATSPNPVAQNLTIGSGGILTFAMQLPDSLNGTAITGTMPLNFTISSMDGTLRANAIFLAIAAGGTPSATTTTTSSNSSGGTGSTTGTTGSATLFITSPSINATIPGGAVTVTGSGSAVNNSVGVQVLDANYQLLGSAIATIQAGAGAIGPWQTTVSFPQPGAGEVGYIVAYTVNSAGTIVEQASIPVFLTGTNAPTVGPTVQSTIPPTVPPVITGVAPTAQGQPSFVTATPQ